MAEIFYGDWGTFSDSFITSIGRKNGMQSNSLFFRYF